MTVSYPLHTSQAYVNGNIIPDFGNVRFYTISTAVSCGNLKLDFLL